MTGGGDTSILCLGAEMLNILPITAIALTNPGLDAPKPLPTLVVLKVALLGTSLRLRAGEIGFNNSRSLRSQVRAPHREEWKNQEGQRGSRAVLSIELRGTGLAQMTSPRLLQADTV